MALRHVLPGGWREDPATPDDAKVRVSIAGVDVRSLADRFGTPLYVYDEAHILDRLRAFREAFGDETVLVYAGKAFLCGALVRILDREGWWIDVVSEGELETARRAGCPPGRILMHGNAPPVRELAIAAEMGIGRVVVDHEGEIGILSGLAANRRPLPVLLRLNADVAAETHEKVRTTGVRAQFGMTPAAAARAAEAAASAPGVELAGVHIHVGSQIRDLDTFRRAAIALVDFVAGRRSRFGGRVDLDLGGGLGVPYTAQDPPGDPGGLARAIREGLSDAGADDRLGEYRLLVEPGRSVVATAGCTLYRVEVRKRLPDGGDVVALDGGLSDNPRPALYGQRYEVRSVTRAGDPHDRVFHVVGRHCETGDRISDEAALPADTAPGDVVAVLVTGAYAFSMSSRYNGLRRPAVVFVREGHVREVVRREGLEDLLSCDLALDG